MSAILFPIVLNLATNGAIKMINIDTIDTIDTIGAIGGTGGVGDRRVGTLTALEEVEVY
jgi:hypothetical protein